MTQETMRPLGFWLEFLPGLTMVVGIGLALCVALFVVQRIGSAANRKVISATGVIYAVGACVYALLAPGFIDGGVSCSRYHATRYMKDSGMALLQYRESNDERLPHIECGWSTCAQSF